MAFDWSQIINQGLGAGVPTSAPVPQQGASSSGGGFNWASLIPTLAPIGGKLASDYLSSKLVPNNGAAITAKESGRQFDIANAEKQAERGRRNMISGMAAPALFRDLGYRDPAKIASMQQQLQGVPAAGAAGLGSSAEGSTNPGNYTPAPPQGSSAAKGIGIAGGLGSAAAGIAGATGLLPAAIAGPIGLAAGGAGMLGSFIASKVGQGRRTANAFVQSVQNPFGEDLKKALAMAQNGDQQGAQQLFNTAFTSFKNAANQYTAAGGKEAIVAKQAMDPVGSKALWDTIQMVGNAVGVPVQ